MDDQRNQQPLTKLLLCWCYCLTDLISEEESTALLCLRFFMWRQIKFHATTTTAINTTTTNRSNSSDNKLAGKVALVFLRLHTSYSEQPVVTVCGIRLESDRPHRIPTERLPVCRVATGPHRPPYLSPGPLLPLPPVQTPRLGSLKQEEDSMLAQRDPVVEHYPEWDSVCYWLLINCQCWRIYS